MSNAARESSAKPRGDAKETGRTDGRIGTSLSAQPFAMVITDPHLPDNPIIYVNKAFERITQYTADYAVGRNCRFLQGGETREEDIDRLREGIRRGEDVSVDLLNYRADGSTFMNRLLIAPLFDGKGEVVNYLGIQRPLPVDQATGSQARADDPVEQDLRRELAEGREEGHDRSSGLPGALSGIRTSVQDHLTLMMNLARLESEGDRTEPQPRTLGRRIESLQLLYEELDEAGVASVYDRNIPAGAYLSRVAATLNHLEGRRSIRMNVDCDAMLLPSDVAARLGLIAAELILNALRHAFVDRRDGLVNVEFKLLSGNRVRLTVKDDGVGMDDEDDWPYSQDESAEEAEEERTGLRVGAKLVRRLVKALDASLDMRSTSVGTTVELALDLDEDGGVRNGEAARSGVQGRSRHA